LVAGAGASLMDGAARLRLATRETGFELRELPGDSLANASLMDAAARLRLATRETGAER
jgi:hypothetical protein